MGARVTRPPSDTQRLLTALSDGKPHSHRELYGLGLMAHSRAADLRRRGHDVEVWRDGKDYLYRLIVPVAA